MNRETVVKLLLALVGVAWLFAVTLAYYVVHKPFSLDNLQAILNALGDILVAGLLFLLAAAIGRRALRSLAMNRPLQVLVFETAIGFGIISFATLALGLLGFVNPLPFWIVLVVALLLLRAELKSLWHDLRTLALPAGSGFERGLALFCGLALLVALLYALLPPTAWDAQTYHLVEGKLAIERGRISAPPDNVYFSFPSLVEMIYLAGMVLKGDIVPQVIHVGFLLLLLGAVFTFCEQRLSSLVAWLACALLAAVPSLVSIAAAPYVDIPLALYSFAAFYAAVEAKDRGDWRWFALAGVFAGLAMGVKYTAVIVPLALVLVLLRSRVRLLLCAAAAAALVAAPWYLRNLAFTGNPFYPFLFGGPFWDSLRAEQFSRFGSGLINTPLALLVAPWDATVLGQEGGVAYDATIGPLLLALLPLLLLTIGRVRERVVRDLVVFGAVLYVFWLVGLAESKLLLQTRLLLPAFPLFAVAAAVAFDRLELLALAQFSLQRFARLVLVLVLGLTAAGYVIGLASSDTLQYLSGVESRNAYLHRHLDGYYDAMQFVNTTLPANSKTLFLWEPRSYYAQPFVQPDVLLDTWRDLRFHYGDAAGIAAALKREGYTHVLLSRAGLDYMLQSGYDPITSDDVNDLTQTAARYLRQIYGKTPLDVVAREGKPGLVDAEADPYAVYAIVFPGSTP